MSTAKQAHRNKRAAKTDTAHPSQATDPGEKIITGDDRLPGGASDRQGEGVDETGNHGRAPHSVK